MKRSLLTLLTSTLLATSLVGCAETTSPEPAKQTPIPSSPVPDKKPSDNTTGGNQDTKQTEGSLESTEASHKEIKEAYGLGGDYFTLSPVMLAGIASGKVELPLEQAQRLALAKAISGAIASSGWKQGDLPPGIFLAKDGSMFAIGMKLSNGDLQLETYEPQPDGTYKSTKKETKPGKK